VSPYNFGASGSILTKHFPRDVPRGRGDKMDITFGRTAHWNLGGRKKRPKFGAISDNFKLWSRVSPERINLSQIPKADDQLQPIPRWEKKMVNYGLHTKKLYGLILTHPNGHFSADYILALGVLPPQIFTRATDWPSLLAHTRTGRGSPQPASDSPPPQK